MLLKWIVLLLFSTSLTLAQSTRNRHRAQLSARPPHSTSQARSAKELSNLIKNLRAKGATVAITNEKVSQPFFSVSGRIININDESVQVFKYANVSAADDQAKPVAPDGMTIGTSKPSWMAPPHFFKSGKLIVLYVGANESILKVLQASLGAQFAGS